MLNSPPARTCRRRSTSAGRPDSHRSPPPARPCFARPTMRHIGSCVPSPRTRRSPGFDRTLLRALTLAHALLSSWLAPCLMSLRRSANTRRIADQCSTAWDFQTTIFPSFRQMSADGAFETLRAKTYKGAVWRYGVLSEVGPAAHREGARGHSRETICRLFSRRR
jgi:hypothetical protein